VRGHARRLPRGRRRPRDVDLFVYHQANRGSSTRSRAPGAARERLVDAIGELGNTSAASIPLALSVAADEGLLAPGSRVLVGAMGSGFTMGPPFWTGR